VPTYKATFELVKGGHLWRGKQTYVYNKKQEILEYRWYYKNELLKSIKKYYSPIYRDESEVVDTGKFSSQSTTKYIHENDNLIKIIYYGNNKNKITYREIIEESENVKIIFNSDEDRKIQSKYREEYDTNGNLISSVVDIDSKNTTYGKNISYGMYYVYAKDNILTERIRKDDDKVTFRELCKLDAKGLITDCEYFDKLESGELFKMASVSLIYSDDGKIRISSSFNDRNQDGEVSHITGELLISFDELSSSHQRQNVLAKMLLRNY
jgi:hypothetical protein